MYEMFDSVTDAVAMDCEMVGVSQGNKSALGRVTLVFISFFHVSPIDVHTVILVVAFVCLKVGTWYHKNILQISNKFYLQETYFSWKRLQRNMSPCRETVSC